ncbi:MAG: gliding motility-associated C-terminal domain-containing protein [Chitinophagales bacterium]
MRNLLLSLMLLYMARGTLLAQNCSINAGLNNTICLVDSMKLYGTRSGYFTPNATSKWTQLSGPHVTINQPDSLITSVSGYTEGVYTFQLSNKCQDGISSADTVTVTILPLTKANAGRDTLLCPSATYHLNANSTLLPGETGEWSSIINNGGLIINNPYDPKSLISLQANLPGVLQLRWTITNINGCVSYDDVMITNCGGTPLVNAGPDQYLDNCYVGSACTKLIATNGSIGIGGQNGMWTFVSGPSNPTISYANTPLASVCNLIPGIYVFRYTVSGPCSNGMDEISVTVPPASQNAPAANAGNGMVICDMTTTITLSGSIPESANEIVQWSQISGPVVVSINSPNSPTTIVTGLTNPGTYSFNYTMKNSTTNCSGIGVVNISKYQPGSVDGGPDQILPCNVTETVIPTVTTGFGYLTYRIISGPVGAFSYPTRADTRNVIKGLTYPGTYRVEINYQFGSECAAGNDFVDITVSRPPTGANAGTYQNFNCASATTQLAGNNPMLTGLGSGRWSQVSGPNTANLATPDNYLCNISGTVAGRYVFRWTVSGGLGCPDNHDDIVVISPGNDVTKANAGADRQICANSPITLQGNSFRADETAKWTAIPNNVTFMSDNTIATPVVSGLQPNTNYTFIYKISNSCGSVSVDSVKISTGTISGPSAANAGSDQCLPENTNTIQLNALQATSGIGYWNLIDGNTVTIVNPTLNNTNVTGIKNGTYKFVWSVSVNGCSNNTTDTVLVTIGNTATTANAGPDVAKCATTYTLNGNKPITGNGHWSQISGDGAATIASCANPVTTVSNLNTGSYTFRWTIENGACPANADDVTITVSSPPSVANACADINICGGASSATLQATAPTSGTGQWVWVSGTTFSPTIRNSTLTTATVNGLASGSHTFRWIVTGGAGCPQSTDDVVVNVSMPANAGADKSLCNVTSTTLKGNSGSNGTWTQVSGPQATITQSPAGNPTANISGLQPNASYVFRYTIPAFAGCAASYDDVIVNNGSSTLIANAGSDDTYCDVSSFALSGSVPGAGETGTWSIISGAMDAVFLPNANTPNAVLTNVKTGVYILKWTISNGTCTTSDTKKIENQAVSTIVNAGNDFSLCNSISSIPLSGASVNGFTTEGYWSIVSGQGTLSNTNSTSFPNTVTFSPATGYTGPVVLRLSANDKCKTVTDEITILIEKTSAATQAVNDSVSTEPNTEVDIAVLKNDIILNNDKLCDDAIIVKPSHGTVSVNGDGTVSYQPMNGYIGIDSFSYQLCNSVVKQGSCYADGKDNAWVFITIEGCIFPNAFSPDGDGINDVFEIPCAQGDMQFTVFNRSGIEVYKNDFYRNDWNGTYNGSPLPDGTYYYMLSYSTDKINKLNKNGFITLRR